MKQSQCNSKMTNEAGISVNAIINNLFKEFTCSICLHLFKNPVTVSLCKHTYCLDCLKEWKVISDGKTFKCPLCKNVTTNRSYYPNEKYASAVKFLLALQTFMESKRNKDTASNSSSVLLSQCDYRNTLLQKYLNECVKYKSEYENDGPENIPLNSQIITLSNTSNKENNNNAISESNDLITESEENEFILNIVSTAENINIINKLEDIFIEDLEKETKTKNDPKQDDKTPSSTKKKKNDTSVNKTSDSAKKTDWSRLKQTNRDINKKAGKYKPLKLNETKAKNENSVKKRNTRSSKNQTTLGDFDEYLREKNDTSKNTIENEPIVINSNSEKSAEIVQNDDDDIFLRSTQILSLDNLNPEVSIIKLGNKRKSLNCTLTKEEETAIKKQKTPDKNENVIVISADVHHSNDSIVEVPINNKSSSADIIENSAENVKITKVSNKKTIKSAPVKDPALLNLSNEFKESLKTVSELKSSVLQNLEQNLKESDQILSEYSNLVYNSDSLFSSESPVKLSKKDGPNKTKLLHNVFSAPTLEVTSRDSITFYNTAIPCLEKIKGYYQQLKALSDQLSEQSTASIENSSLGNKGKVFADTEVQTDILKCPTCTFTFNLKSATNTSTPGKRSGSNESNIFREESIQSKTPKRESQSDILKKETSKFNTSKTVTSRTNTSKEESKSDFPKKESSKSNASKANTSKTNTSKEESQSDIPKKETSKFNTSKTVTSRINTSKEESKSDFPKTESSKSNTSKANTSKANTSKINTSKEESQSDFPKKESSKSNTSKANASKTNTSKEENQSDFPKKESSKLNTSKTTTSKEASQSDFPKKESSKLNTSKTTTSKEERQSDFPKRESSKLNTSKTNTSKAESQSDNPKKESSKSNTSKIESQSSTPKNEKLNTSKIESPRKDSSSDKTESTSNIPSKGSESNSEDFNAFLEDIKKNISKNPPSDALPQIPEEDDTKKKRFKRIRTPSESDSEESSETSKKSKNNSYQSKLLYRDSIDVCFHSTTSQMYSNIEPPNKSNNFENNQTILDPGTKNSKSSEDTLLYLEQQYHNPIVNNNTLETGVLEKNANLDNLLSGIDVSAFENDFTVTNKNAPESNQLNQKTDLSASLFTETQVNKLNSSIAKPDKINESTKNVVIDDVDMDSVVEDSYESDEIFEDDVVDTTPQKTLLPKRINTSEQLNCSASNSQFELRKLQNQNLNQNQQKLNITSMTPDFLPLSNLDLNCGFFDNSKFMSKNTPNQNNIVDQVQNNLKPILLAQNDDLPLQLVKQDNYVPNKNKLENKQPQLQSSILSYFNAHPQSTPTSRVTNQQPTTSNSDVEDRCESPVLHARSSSATAAAAPTVFCTSRLNKREITEVANYAPRLNATYSKVFDETVTHLIVSVDENNRVVDQTLKYLLAIAHGIWIVSHSWFKNSVVQNRLLPEEYYEVLDMSGVPGPRLSRLRRRESPIFEDFVFVIVEPLVTVTKTELEDVILNLGGEIKKSLLDFEKYPGKHYLILSEGKYCENDAQYEKLKEDYGIMSVDIEWLSESVGRYKLISIRGYMLCSDDNIEKYGYPPELIAPIPESQIQTLSHDDV